MSFVVHVGVIVKVVGMVVVKVVGMVVGSAKVVHVVTKVCCIVIVHVVTKVLAQYEYLKLNDSAADIAIVGSQRPCRRNSSVTCCRCRCWSSESDLRRAWQSRGHLICGANVPETW